MRDWPRPEHGAVDTSNLRAVATFLFYAAIPLSLSPFLSLSLSWAFAKWASRASNYFINHLGAVVVTVQAPRLAARCQRFGISPLSISLSFSVSVSLSLSQSAVFSIALSRLGTCCSNSENAFNVCLV